VGREFMIQLFFRKALTKVLGISQWLIGYMMPISPILERAVLKPQCLGIETTNICNANCVFCGYQYMKRPKGTMRMDIFEKAIRDFIYIGGGDIRLTPIVGDPLVDDYLLERIKYARKFKEIKRIGFFTNGILLRKIGYKDLLFSGVTDIDISLELEKDRYKEIYRVDAFDRVAENILALCETNRELNNPVTISINLRLGKFKVDSILFKKIKEVNKNITYQSYYDSWSGKIKQADLPDFMLLRTLRRKRKPCYFLYVEPLVQWDGNITACPCRDLDGDAEFSLGNIVEKSLIEMWRSDKLRNLRISFFEGKIPSMCSGCRHYNDISILRAPHFRKLIQDSYNAYLCSDYAHKK